jgi:hypothetical protein
MNPLWIERIGNWNPQFLRECRGRLKTRTILVAIAASVIVQIMILMSFNQFRNYFSQTPQQNWLDLFRSLTWIFPYFLFLSGSYMLISDVTQEERRGTLNFIRLSPRTSQSILLGKMLGVPILPYLSIVLLIPLHLIAALNGGVPIIFMFSYYLILGASTFFLFSFALLVASLGNTQTLAGSRQSTAAVSFSGLTFFFFAPMFMFWNLGTTWSLFSEVLGTNRRWLELDWMYVPISTNFLFSHLFVLANLAIATFGIWQVLRRRFYNPSSTTLSKYQSYALVAYVQILMFGFAVATPLPYVFFAITSINFCLSLLLISAITPMRQAILDWVRFERRSLKDWIWSEKSPAPIAIAINLIIISCIWVPWGLLSGTISLGLGIVIPLSQAFVVLIYALIAQLILVKQIQKPATWATGTIAALLFLPPIFLGLLTITPDKVPTLWLFLGYFWASDQPANYILPLIVQFIAIAWLGSMLLSQLESLRVMPKSQSTSLSHDIGL